MFLRHWPAFLLAMAAAAPALAQDNWLPTEPPEGLELRIWFAGPEAASVALAIRFGDEPWCAIGGHYSPDRQIALTGNYSAGTDCGLEREALERLLAPDKPVPVQLKGTVTLETGAVVTVSQTTDADLEDVWDAAIELSGDGVAFSAVKG